MRWINFSAHTNKNILFIFEGLKEHFFCGDNMNLENIFSFENLYNAHKKCKRSKQHKGKVIRFETNIFYKKNFLKIMTIKSII